MEQDRPSVSALISAFARAYHAAHGDPKIFDDYLAAQLFTEQERAMFENNLAESLKFFDPDLAAQAPDKAAALAGFMRLQGAPITLSRARYVEDTLEKLVAQGVTQYVILGAGLDTFAFRRCDLLDRLQVFELDHPATQADKRQRLARLGWQLAPQLHMLPIDFNRDSLTEILCRSPFDPQALTLFSWLGVTYYLERDIVFNTLRDVTQITPAGSSVIFDYLDADAFVPQRAARRVRMMQAATLRAGEPMKTGFDPSALATELQRNRLHLRENLSPADIQARYFQNRSDGYHAYEHIHFAWAMVT